MSLVAATLESLAGSHATLINQDYEHRITRQEVAAADLTSAVERARQAQQAQAESTAKFALLNRQIEVAPEVCAAKVAEVDYLRGRVDKLKSDADELERENRVLQKELEEKKEAVEVEVSEVKRAGRA